MKVNFDLKKNTIWFIAVLLVVIAGFIVIRNSVNSSKQEVLAQIDIVDKNSTQRDIDLQNQLNQVLNEMSIDRTTFAEFTQKYNNDFDKIIQELEIIKTEILTLTNELSLTREDIKQLESTVNSNQVELLSELRSLDQLVKSVSSAVGKSVTAQQVMKLNRCLAQNNNDMIPCQYIIQ